MYASLYKNVLRFVLKESKEAESRISYGTKFQRVAWSCFQEGTITKRLSTCGWNMKKPSFCSSDLKE